MVRRGSVAAAHLMRAAGVKRRGPFASLTPAS
jgi:hypothetical protein